MRFGWIGLVAVWIACSGAAAVRPCGVLLVSAYYPLPVVEPNHIQNSYRTRIRAEVLKSYAEDPEHSDLKREIDSAEIYLVASRYALPGSDPQADHYIHPFFDSDEYDIIQSVPERLPQSVLSRLGSFHVYQGDHAGGWYAAAQTIEFGLRIPGREYRVLLSARPGLKDRSVAEEIWCVDGFHELNPGVWAARPGDSNVRRLETENDWKYYAASGVRERLQQKYALEAESLGRPHFGYGFLEADDSPQFSFGTGPVSYFAVLDPQTARPIGFLASVQARLTNSGEHYARPYQGAFGPRVETYRTDTYEYRVPFSVEGYRIDVWEPGANRIPRGEKVSVQRTEVVRAPRSAPAQRETKPAPVNVNPSLMQAKALPSNGVVPKGWAELTREPRLPIGELVERWTKEASLGPEFRVPMGSATWVRPESYLPYDRYGLWPEEMEITLSPNGRWAFNLASEAFDLQRGERVQQYYGDASAGTFSADGRTLFIAAPQSGLRADDTIRALDATLPGSHESSLLWEHVLPVFREPDAKQTRIPHTVIRFGTDGFLISRMQRPRYAQTRAVDQPAGSFFTDRVTAHSEELDPRSVIWGVTDEHIILGAPDRAPQLVRYTFEDGAPKFEKLPLSRSRRSGRTFRPISTQGDHYLEAGSIQKPKLFRLERDGTHRLLGRFVVPNIQPSSRDPLIHLTPSAWRASNTDPGGGSYLAYVDTDNAYVPNVVYYDSTGSPTVHELEHLGHPNSHTRGLATGFGFSDDARLAAIALVDQRVAVYALRGKETPRLLGIHNTKIIGQALRFSADLTTLAVIGGNGVDLQTLHIRR